MDSDWQKKPFLDLAVSNLVAKRANLVACFFKNRDNLRFFGEIPDYRDLKCALIAPIGRRISGFMARSMGWGMGEGKQRGVVYPYKRHIFMSINGSSGIAWWQMTPLIVNVEKVYGHICGNQIHLFRIAV